MRLLIDAGVILLGYILGSIPFGLIFVKLISGKDVRYVASGRTGGTNAARAAGFGAGLLTAFMDIVKGVIAVWIAQAILPSNHWVHILTPIAVILGHNYSLFIIEREQDGRLRFRGGAGGGPTAGGAIGLWWPIALILLPVALLVFFGIGYASITTLSAALIIIIVFAIRYAMGLGSLADIFYGVAAFLLLAWALRPNIKALIEGRERFHGWRPWRKAGTGFPENEPPRKQVPLTRRGTSKVSTKKRSHKQGVASKS